MRAKRGDLPIRSQLVGPILAYLRAKGVDPTPLERAYDLPPTAASDPEVLLPLSRLQAFFEDAERVAADPFLGLHVALGAPVGRWSAIEYAARSAPTLREALVRLVRYVALFNEHVRVTFEERAGEGIVTQRIPGRPLSIGRHGNEFFAASVLCRSRAGLAPGTPLVPRRVFFAHARPRDVSELVSFFGTDRIEFGTEKNGFALDGGALERPMAARDPALLALVDAYANAELERRGTDPGAGFLGQVRLHVREGLSSGGVELGALAGALRMSTRSVQRRLAEHDTSLQDLVQSVREEMARTWVTAGDRPLGEIAYALGYAELGPFVRAFRRWTGKTPAAYRTQTAHSAQSTVKAGKRT